LKEWRLTKAIIVATLTILSSILPVHGRQTLDQAVEEQLQSSGDPEIVCGVLRRGNTQVFVPGFDRQLQRICQAGGPASGGGASAGGAATTTQGFRIDIQQRLNAARGKQETGRLENKLVFRGLEDVALVDISAGLPSGNSRFFTPNYRRPERDQKTIERESEQWSVVGNSDYQFLTPDIQKIEENHHKTANGYKSSSSIAPIGGQSHYKKLLQSQGVVLASSDTTSAVVAFSESAGGLLTVTGVDILEATTDSAIILVQTNKDVVNYNTFMLSDPPRIVIDIAGALVTESMLREEAGQGPIKQIRSSQYRRKPVPVVRVVLDLTSTRPYKVVGLPDTFRILIGDALETADQVEASEVETGPLQIMGVEIQDASIDSAIIQILSDQAVDRYDIFTLSGPPRIVIDITGALLVEPMVREEAGKGAITRIRSSQFRLKPEPVVRVVLDLASPLAYQVAGLPDTFQLFIGEAVAKADPIKPLVPPPEIAEKPKPAPKDLSIATEPVEPVGRQVGVWVIGEKLSVWVAGEYEDLDRDRTNFEDGYDSDVWRATAGADYQFTDQFLAGLALGYDHWDGDYDSGGDFDVDTWGLIAYASLFTRPGIFIDATMGYARSDYERSRRTAWAESGANDVLTSGIATGDYDGNEYSASVLLGYDYPIDRFTIGPRAGLTYVYADYDSYEETGRFRGGGLGAFDDDFNSSTPTGLELAFEEDDRTSLQSSLGLKATGTFRVDGASIIPQLFFDWRHEFKDDQRSIDVRFVQDNRDNPQEFRYSTESPDRNFYYLGGAISTVFDNGFQSFVAARTLLGHDFYDSTSVSFGLRIDF
jgi:outer membrane autotransporter protein